MVSVFDPRSWIPGEIVRHNRSSFLRRADPSHHTAPTLFPGRKQHVRPLVSGVVFSSLVISPPSVCLTVATDRIRSATGFWCADESMHAPVRATGVRKTGLVDRKKRDVR